MEDMNLVVLYGRLAIDAEVKTFDSGTQVMHFLLAVEVEEPRPRVDLLPVAYWLDEPWGYEEVIPTKGERFLVVGSVQRRYWESPDGRRSRVEIIAEHVERRDSPPDLSLIMGGRE